LQKHVANLTEDQAGRLETYLDNQPAVARIYEFKEEMMAILSAKRQAKAKCRMLVYQLLDALRQLRQSPVRGLPEARPHPGSLAGRDRPDVALLTLERHHRGLPPKDETDPAPRLRIPKFRELPPPRPGAVRVIDVTMETTTTT
jgi:hypothetical protein